MRRVFLVSLSVLFGVSCMPSLVRAMGEETFGNQPLNALNYKDWPGIVPVINHESRVYHVWVNGNEYAYYRGDIDALHDVLQKFADTNQQQHEVVLRPGPASTKSFRQTKTIPFHWELHLVGGIARAIAKKDQGEKIWNPYPMLSIYIDETIPLDQLKFPAGLTLLELTDLEKRFSGGLTSTDITVRGWDAGLLARLNPYSSSNMNAIAKLLDDNEVWVRLNAAGALAVFGKKATPLLPDLKSRFDTDDAALKKRLAETIKIIESAPDKSKAEKQHQETLKQISQFLKTRER
ncbi:HEAT repeat domain-containing protein [Gimesia maris]|uniref:HEAT repeat domain-containing protein n=1 Tax=Gimesia maris TaxID=122 RepID=UPI00241D5A6F|nr:HEAT repeat domain-containing protein [Gimesia maris]